MLVSMFLRRDLHVINCEDVDWFGQYHDRIIYSGAITLRFKLNEDISIKRIITILMTNPLDFDGLFLYPHIIGVIRTFTSIDISVEIRESFQ